MECDIVEFSNGSRFYYKKGTKNMRRLDGSAIEEADYEEWWCHREDGPAVEHSNGHKEWWVNNERLSPEKETILNKWWDNENGI